MAYFDCMRLNKGIDRSNAENCGDEFKFKRYVAGTESLLKYILIGSEFGNGIVGSTHSVKILCGGIGSVHGAVVVCVRVAVSADPPALANVFIGYFVKETAVYGLPHTGVCISVRIRDR